jgi:hypothetical protein
LLKTWRLAAAGSLFDWTATAVPLLQGVSPETSDGKTKYGKCIVKLPISKMGNCGYPQAGSLQFNTDSFCFAGAPL